MARSRKPRGFPVNGMLLLDKPADISSNHALQHAKRLLCARKAGHTGSLDPIATGLLPICFGDATKISGLFLDADKSYWVRIRLGEETETGDCEGEVTVKRPVNLETRDIEKALEDFRGTFDQVPPMYSALKRNGQPLYKLARQGIEVERPPREVTVYSLSLVKHEANEIELELSCSRGFYVRSLAIDLGNALGCGGHVLELRRTGVGQFSVDNAITLPQLELVTSSKEREKLLLPIDESLSHFPKVRIPDNIALYFCRGQTVRIPQTIQSGMVRVYSDSSKFLGLAEAGEDRKVSPKRLFQSQ